MWQLDNRTPFAVDRDWVRDRDGSEIWLVAVKATFDIRPDGGMEVSPVQPPVLRVPVHHGEPGKSSIKYEADLILTKKTTDVVLVGHAYAPPGATVKQTDVGLRVGSLQKVLRVFGDRTWGTFGASSPQPFERMPLVYERAYGGVDAMSSQPEKDWEWRNPVGRGFAISSRHAADRPLPNVEDPSNLISSWDDRPPPAGFGAIACHWQPRVAFAGTYDEHWLKTRQPLLAEDLDDRYFQCAPLDQQTPEFLRGGEPVALHNLTPGGSLRFVLPKLYLGFETHFYDGSKEVHQNRKLHTVILEPDFPRVSLVWHSALSCHFKGHKLERTLIRLKRDQSSQDVAVNDFDLERA
jgi:hypothetical protein